MNTKISLYYANWCGHCKNFMPQWNALKEFLKNKNVTYEEFEDTKDTDIISSKNIQGFPTIKITKNNQEYDYYGERTIDAIINELNIQKGGSNYKKYVIKYIS